MPILSVFETDFFCCSERLVWYKKRSKIVFSRFIFTIYDMRIPGVTRGYRGLQGVTRCYKGLQGVRGRYKGLQGVARGCKGLQGVTRG